MLQYDLVTVVYEEEIELLALQARSIDLFGRGLSINTIYVIANGLEQERTMARVRAEVLPKYGARSAQVEIVPATALTQLSETPAGWHSQQVLKLAIAARVNSDFYVTLDAKNHLVREADDGIFFDRNGIPLFHPASFRDANMIRHYYKSAELCGIDADKHIDWGFPSITPSVLYRSHVIGLHKFISHTHHTTFEKMLCNDFMTITEYMMYYCYLRRLEIFDKLYAPGPRIVVTLWTTQVDSDSQFRELMHEVQTTSVPFFSLHRLARARLTTEQAARIGQFWQQVGLVRDAHEAGAYLAPCGEGERRAGERRRWDGLQLRRWLDRAAVGRQLKRVAASVGGRFHRKAGGPGGPETATGGKSITVKTVESDAADSFELRDRILALGRLLRPMQAVGYAKRRFGSRNDGGYVMLDDFTGIVAAFSLGIAGNTDWDWDVANRNIPVYQFDNSVDGVRLAHPHYSFHRAMIGPGQDQLSFDKLMSAYAAVPLDRASAIMKMDIEHWEWPTLAAADPANLRKLRQLAVEFHCFDLIVNPYWWMQAKTVFAKLQEEFRVIHVHGHSGAGSLHIGGVPFPNVLEVTYASRHHYTFEETDELFPTPLDAANDPELPDLYLGAFKF